MKAFHQIFTLSFIILFCCLFGNAQQAVLASFRAGDSVFQITEESNLRLKGTTNVTGFTCECEENFAPIPFGIQKVSGNKVVFYDTRLNIQARLLDCGNKKMNKDMQQTLGAEKHPYIVVELKEVSGGLNSSSEWTQLTAKATITINGVTQKVEVPLKGQQLGNDKFRFKGLKTLCMSDYGITPPRPFLGMIVVEDEIGIDFDLVVRVGEGRG